jgi:hypothetical protein
MGKIKVKDEIKITVVKKDDKKNELNKK